MENYYRPKKRSAVLFGLTALAINGFLFVALTIVFLINSDSTESDSFEISQSVVTDSFTQKINAPSHEKSFTFSQGPEATTNSAFLDSALTQESGPSYLSSEMQDQLYSLRD